MKTSFTAFWRRNLAFFRLAVQNHLEYRFNFLTDALISPVVAALIEVALWSGIFGALATPTLAGYGKESYLAYAFWASFVARISSNWQYESKMIDEIESGSINVLLSRPTGYFESYTAQFLGYKTLITGASLLVPVLACALGGLPLHYDRLPAAILLVFYYLFLVQLLSFCVATIAFYLTRVHSFTVAKNLSLWLFSGELIPLDLLPPAFRDVLLSLPFANAVYVPVAYVTGRVGTEVLARGFLSTTLGIIFFGWIAHRSWTRGIRQYTGTGA